MLCNICQTKDATVHLTQIVEGKMHKVDLCESCAKEKGINDPSGFSLADMLLGLGAGDALEASDGKDIDASCPFCGFTQKDFKKTGRMGCTRCYDTFRAGLVSMLKNMHKGMRHIGKVPTALKRSRDFDLKLQNLKEALEKAVDEEDFEQAALYRDEINDLKKELEKTSVV